MGARGPGGASPPPPPWLGRCYHHGGRRNGSAHARSGPPAPASNNAPFVSARRSCHFLQRRHRPVVAVLAQGVLTPSLVGAQNVFRQGDGAISIA